MTSYRRRARTLALSAMVTILTVCSSNVGQSEDQKESDADVRGIEPADITLKMQSWFVDASVEKLNPLSLLEGTFEESTYARLVDSIDGREGHVAGAATDGATRVWMMVECPGPGKITYRLDRGGADGAFSRPEVLNNSSRTVEVETYQDAESKRHFGFVLYVSPEVYGPPVSSPDEHRRTIPITLSWDPDRTLLPHAEPREQHEVFALVRPPVILLHGTYDNPNDCWRQYPQADLTAGDYPPGHEAMYNALLGEGFTLPNGKPAVFTVSYENDTVNVSEQGKYTSSGLRKHERTVQVNGVDRGSSSFVNLAHVLWENPGGIRDALAAYREAGIASTQADVICHGMGGLVARLYIRGAHLYERRYPQPFDEFPDRKMPIDRTVWYYRTGNFMQGDVHRLITICTGHKGSDASALANPGDIAPVEGDTGQERKLGTVFHDQQPNSEALNAIGATPVPAHAIVGALGLESALGGLQPDVDASVIDHVLHGHATTAPEVQTRVMELLRGGFDEFNIAGFPLAGGAIEGMPVSEVNDAPEASRIVMEVKQFSTPETHVEAEAEPASPLPALDSDVVAVKPDARDTPTSAHISVFEHTSPHADDDLLKEISPLELDMQVDLTTASRPVDLPTGLFGDENTRLDDDAGIDADRDSQTIDSPSGPIDQEIITLKEGTPIEVTTGSRWVDFSDWHFDEEIGRIDGGILIRSAREKQMVDSSHGPFDDEKIRLDSDTEVNASSDSQIIDSSGGPIDLEMIPPEEDMPIEDRTGSRWVDFPDPAVEENAHNDNGILVDAARDSQIGNSPHGLINNANPRRDDDAVVDANSDSQIIDSPGEPIDLEMTPLEEGTPIEVPTGNRWVDFPDQPIDEANTLLDNGILIRTARDSQIGDSPHGLFDNANPRLDDDAEVNSSSDSQTIDSPSEPIDLEITPLEEDMPIEVPTGDRWVDFPDRPIGEENTHLDNGILVRAAGDGQIVDSSHGPFDDENPRLDDDAKVDADRDSQIIDSLGGPVDLEEIPPEEGTPVEVTPGNRWVDFPDRPVDEENTLLDNGILVRAGHDSQIVDTSRGPFGHEISAIEESLTIDVTPGSQTIETPQGPFGHEVLSPFNEQPWTESPTEGSPQALRALVYHQLFHNDADRLDKAAIQGQPVLSADGTRAVFCGKGVYVVDYDGTHLRRVGETEASGAYAADISPDGQWVAFYDDLRVYAARADGSGPGKLLESSYGAFYGLRVCGKPATLLLVCAKPAEVRTSPEAPWEPFGNGIWAIDPNTGSRRHLVDFELMADASGGTHRVDLSVASQGEFVFDASEDGRHLVFTLHARTDRSSRIYGWSAEEGIRELVRVEDNMISSLAISGDGNTVALVTRGSDGGLFAIGFDGSNFREVLSAEDAPARFTDHLSHTRLSYDGSFFLHGMDNLLVRLSDGLARNLGPSWDASINTVFDAGMYRLAMNRDATRFVFISRQESGRTTLTSLTANPSDVGPAPRITDIQLDPLELVAEKPGLKLSVRVSTDLRITHARTRVFARARLDKDASHRDLRDDGRGGDARAADGIYTFDNLLPGTDRKDWSGSRVIRVFIQGYDEQGLAHATAVDYGPWPKAP